MKNKSAAITNPSTDMGYRHWYYRDEVNGEWIDKFQYSHREEMEVRYGNSGDEDDDDDGDEDDEDDEDL